MPIERPPPMRPAARGRADGDNGEALFLLAHPDDEFGVFDQLLHERAAGRRVCCAYLTDGAVAGVAAATREAESLRVLAQLGVAAPDVQFAGRALGVADGRLAAHLPAVGGWLRRQLAAAPPVALYVPAWEGGHPDHDALHAAAVRVAQTLGLLERVRQFPLYQAAGLPAPLFRVLAPLPGNGPVERRAIPWRRRLRYLRLCLGYPSQWKSWLGLFPGVLLHHLLDGRQALQRVQPDRLQQRPHAGRLYYEARGFSSWEALSRSLQQWQA